MNLYSTASGGFGMGRMDNGRDGATGYIAVFKTTYLRPYFVFCARERQFGVTNARKPPGCRGFHPHFTETACMEFRLPPNCFGGLATPSRTRPFAGPSTTPPLSRPFKSRASAVRVYFPYHLLGPGHEILIRLATAKCFVS